MEEGEQLKFRPGNFNLESANFLLCVCVCVCVCVYIYIYTHTHTHIYIFSPGATQPIVGVYFTALYRALAPSLTRLLYHTQRRATVGRTPLNE